MRIPTLPNTVARRLSLPMSLRSLDTELDKVVEPVDGDEAVNLDLSDTARELIERRSGKSGQSPTHLAMQAIKDGVVPSNMPFGQVVKAITQGHNFYAKASTDEADEAEAEEDAEALAPAADTDTGLDGGGGGDGGGSSAPATLIAAGSEPVDMAAIDQLSKVLEDRL